MPEPIPGAPNDDTRSLVPGGGDGEFSDDGVEVAGWVKPERVGPYRVGRELGRGGMAAVYLAVHADDGREVALKVMTASPDPAGQELTARFEREGAAAMRLSDHPNIVTVYDVGRDGNVCYMAMAAIEGSPLNELCDAGDLSTEQAAFIVERVAGAVQHAHDGGVLHRDIKPSNVLVRPDGTPLLADFGLARTYGRGTDLTRLTASGTVLGTPAYMPPEQAQGEAVDARADVYALGATLYETLTGRPPFAADGLLALLQKVVSEEPQPPRRLNATVPAPLEWIVMRCLAKDPDARYTTAGALAADLARFRAGDAVEAGRGDVVRRVKGLARRRPLLLAVGIGGTATMLISGGMWWWSGRAQHGRTAEIAKTHAAVETLGREQQIAGAYYKVSVQTQAAMRRLEDHFHGRLLDAASLASTLRDALKIVAEARAQYPESGVPLAWSGLLRFFGGERDAGEQLVVRACTEFPDDPFPHLLLGRLYMAEYVGTVHGGTLVYGVGRVDIVPATEHDEGTILREQAAASFALGLDDTRWRGVAEGAGYKAFAAAAVLFADRRNAEAAAALRALTDEAQLGSSATALAAAASLFDEQYGQAAALFDELVARGWDLAMGLGSYSHLAFGLERQGRGESPVPQFERVVAMATELINRHAGRAGPFHDRAAARQGLAVWRLAAGEDARPLLHAALEDVAQGHRLSAQPESLIHRAHLAVALARAERQFGGDPAPALAGALRDAEAAVAIRPDIGEWRVTHAETLFQMGQNRERAGLDARAQYTHAAAMLERARATVQDPVPLLHTLGNLYRALALALRRDGEDPFPCLDKSIDAYGEVMVRLPNDGRPASGRGAAWGLRAEWEAAAGRDPERSFDRALADFAEAYRRNPTLASAVQNRAACWSAKGTADATFGRDPRPAFDASIQGFDHALTITPGHPMYLEGRGTAWLARARAERDRGGEPRAAAERSLADLREAVTRDPRSVRRLQLYARTLRQVSAWVNDGAGDSRRTWLGAAARALESVEELRPGSARNLLDLAALYEALDEWAKAADAYARVLTVVPDHAQARDRRDQARQRAK